MRLVTYDRGGARRLGAWVGEAVVDLPDAVGHPAIPSTMEALVARHGGTTLEASQAGLEREEVVRECGVPGARLLAPIVPTSVWRVPSAGDAGSGREDPLDLEVEIACVLARGAGDAADLRACTVFGYSLVDWWDEGFGPTIVTADEVDPDEPRFVITADGRPWMRAAMDGETLRRAIEELCRREDVRPGAVVVFEAVGRPFSRIRRPRVRPGARVDLRAEETAPLRRVSGTA